MITSIKDKSGNLRPIDWDIFCDVIARFSGHTDVFGVPLLHSRRAALAAEAYFNLVEGSFLE